MQISLWGWGGKKGPRPLRNLLLYKKFHHLPSLRRGTLGKSYLINLFELTAFACYGLPRALEHSLECNGDFL